MSYELKTSNVKKGPFATRPVNRSGFGSSSGTRNRRIHARSIGEPPEIEESKIFDIPLKKAKPKVIEPSSRESRL